jgi:hypothetical protein
MVDDCEPNRCSTEVSRRARKDHICNECHRTIKAGEVYRYFSGIDYDRCAFSHKICGHCGVVCDWLAINCNGYVLHGVYEDITEHVETYNRFDLARLQVGMKRDWAAIRKPGLMPLPKVPSRIQLGDAR